MGGIAAYAKLVPDEAERKTDQAVEWCWLLELMPISRVGTWQLVHPPHVAPEFFPLGCCQVASTLQLMAIWDTLLECKLASPWPRHHLMYILYSTAPISRAPAKMDAPRV